MKSNHRQGDGNGQVSNGLRHPGLVLFMIRAAFASGQPLASAPFWRLTAQVSATAWKSSNIHCTWMRTPGQLFVLYCPANGHRGLRLHPLQYHRPRSRGCKIGAYYSPNKVPAWLLLIQHATQTSRYRARSTESSTASLNLVHYFVTAYWAANVIYNESN